jgi:peroxiredoxin
LRHFNELQRELEVNYCHLAVISTDSPEVSAAYRAGLGATYTFLSDHERRAITELDIVDESDPAHPRIAYPWSFSVGPDLAIHKIYDGGWFVGRPTLEELRQDLRAIMLVYHPD